MLGNSCEVKSLFQKDDVLIKRQLTKFLKDRSYLKYGELKKFLKQKMGIPLENIPNDSGETMYDQEEFDTSINNLKESLISSVDKINILDDEKEKVKKYIEREFSDSKTENIKPVQKEEKKEVNLTQEEDEEEREIKDDYEDYFGNNDVLISFFKDDAFHKIFDLCVVQRGPNIESSRLIRNERDLNEGLCYYINKLTRIIHDFLITKQDFLKKNHFDSETGKIKPLALSKYDVNYTYNSLHFPKLMSLFAQYISELKEENENGYFEKLNEDFLNAITGKTSDSNLLEAINAYLMLEHFDDIIKSDIGFIQGNKKYSSPIVKEQNRRGETVTKYKYQLKVKNALKGDWTNTISDALKQTGKFSKRIIESIPRENGGYLKLKDYVAALSRLRSTVNILGNSTWEIALKNAFYDLANGNQPEALYNIFRILLINGKLPVRVGNTRGIFDNDPNRVRRGLISKGIDLKQDRLIDSDFQVFKDVYRFMYGHFGNGKQQVGIWQIENKENSSVINTDVYGICSSIIATFTSTSPVNYLDTRVSDNGNITVQDIKKSKTRNEVFELKSRAQHQIYSTNGYFISYEQPTLEQEKIIKIYFPDKSYRLEIKTIEPTFQFEERNATQSIHIIHEDNGIETSVDIEEFVDGIRGKNKFIGTESFLHNLSHESTVKVGMFLNLLNFIDTELQLELLQDYKILDLLIKDSKEKVLRSTQDDRFSPLNRFVMAAARVLGAADINSRYNEYRINESQENVEYFDDWFKDSRFWTDADRPMRKLLSSDLDNRKIFLEIPNEGRVMIGTSLSEGDTIFDDYSDAKNKLGDKYNKPTTTNGNGDKQPNHSKAFMDIWLETLRTAYVGKAETDYSCVTNNLLFTKEGAINAVLNITMDSEFNKYGESKQVSDFTDSELLQHNFLHKFLLPLKEGQFLAQPVCYSDKKRFINFRIALEKLGIDIFNSKEGEVQNKVKEWATKKEGDYVEAISNTLGNYYKNLVYNIAYDYNRIFGFYDSLNEGDSKEGYFTLDKFKKNREKIEDILFKAEQKLKELNYRDFIEQANSKGVEVYEELHYRPFRGGYCTINETVVRMGLHVFNDENSIAQYLRNQTREYVNSLMQYYTLLKVNNDSYSGILETILGKNGVKDWVTTDGVLILAKKTDSEGNVDNYILNNPIELNEGEHIEYNPAIQMYVYFNALVNENLRHQIMGTEAFHAIKTFSNINILENFDPTQKGLIKGAINILNGKLATDDVENVIVTISDLRTIANAPLETLGEKFPEDLLSKVKLEYENLSSRIQALGILAQSKRTVANPGTMDRYRQGEINGIVSEYTIAVVEDDKAPVFDFIGKNGWSKGKTIDAHDGSAHMTAFTSILENYSLGDNAVGYEVKKPLWDIDIPKYGGRKLVKYAVNTITNELMRRSEASDYSLGMAFKKMADKRWADDEIDLSKKGWSAVIGNKTFGKNILMGKQLFYMLDDKHYEIIDFGRDEDGTYYTKEKEVDASGDGNFNEIRTVYHYFSNEKGHIRSTKKLEGLDTINSLYRLWQAMGGMYCESLVDGNLEYSESSNYIVVNFMNNVCVPTEENARYQKENGKRPPVNQTYYYQPLKYKLIDCIVYKSAMKNGYSNVNSFRDLLDPNKELKTTKASTQKYGPQQDSDHEADEAEVTEMSQVISALDSGGYYHEEVQELYEAIGEQTLKAAQVELDALKGAIEKGDFADLYRVVGNTIINNFSENGGRAGLLESILRNIKKNFNLNENHLNDTFKIPFSDHNVYGQILSTVASILNSKAIKRKYPGIGQVMVPSYGIYQIYEINGKKLQYPDVLKEARNYFRLNPQKRPPYLTDQILYNKTLVDSYLKEVAPDDNIISWKDSKLWTPSKKQEILRNYDPLSRVRIKFKHEYIEGGMPFVNNNLQVEVNLKTIPQYYEFKMNTEDFVKDLILKKADIYDENGNKIELSPNAEISILETSIVRNKPRDLAPARIHFSYETPSGKIVNRNIFDTWPYIELYQLGKQAKNSQAAQISIAHYQKVIIPEFLRLLDQGQYQDRNGNLYKVTDMKYKSAEVIMSNVYASQFGLSTYDSMYDIESNPDYFDNYIDNKIDAEKYDFDFQLLSLNGKKDVYISLSPSSNSDLYSQKKKVWKQSSLYRQDIKDENGNPTQIGNIKHRIYVMDRNNIPLYEVGRGIVAEGVTYDGKNFLDKEGKVISKKRTFYFASDGTICEQIIFLNKYNIIPSNGSSIFTKFCIDRDNLSRCLLPERITNEQYLIRKEISNLINSIFKSDKYALIQPAYNLKRENCPLVVKILDNLIKQAEKEGNQELFNYLKNIKQFVFTIDFGKRKEEYIRFNAGKPFTDEEVRKIFGNEISDDLVKEIKTKILYPSIYNVKRVIKATLKIDDADVLNNLVNEVNKLKRGHEPSKLSYWNKLYMKEISKKRHTSFMKSKFFTSSRIPAQNLQSFMKMECIGFNGSSTNQCAVSHWQAFLQGSDYDIDKSYMMGFEFDDNGIFIGWSNLFDYTSIDTLNASDEYLPLAKNVGFTNDENIKDEDSFIVTEGIGYKSLTTSNEINDRISRLKVIGRILKDLYKSKKTNIKFSQSIPEEDAKAILGDIQKHDNYDQSLNIRDKILKNFISTGIQKISSKIGNLIPSYSPVAIEELRGTLKKAPKAKELEKLSPFNPAMMAILQRINMVGKAVTGISANGQKGQYIWRYAVLEALEQGVDFNQVKFNLNLKGIEGRWSGNIEKESNIQFLPDFDLNEELRDRLLKTVKGEYLKPDIPVDGVISQVISAATDNAKELILGAINAGTKLAKCHLYLMTLGFDVKDIAAFMFSPLISLIDKITDPNIINNQNISANYIITYIRKYLNNKIDPEKNKVPSLRGVHPTIKARFNEELDNLIRNEKGFSIPIITQYLNDLDTFEKVLNGADEFSALGRGLGINQGVKAVNKDLVSWQNSLKNLITKIEPKLKNKEGEWDEAVIQDLYGNGMEVEEFENYFSDIIDGNFTTLDWLISENYRKKTEQFYNPLKITLNPFYIFNHTPHFSSMFKVAGYAVFVINEIPIKSRLLQRYSKELRKYFPRTPFDYEYKFQGIIDKMLISDFLQEQEPELYMEKNWTVLSPSFLEEKWTSSKPFVIKNAHDLCTFKMVFEKYIIPGLKGGTIPIISNTSDKNISVKDNAFIQGLVGVEDKQVPFYKLNIDMLEKENSQEDRNKYQNYKDGLNKLFNYRLTKKGPSIADLFIIYNFIVNANHAGSERLTTIFQDVLLNDDRRQSVNKSFLYKYYKWLGELDTPSNKQDREKSLTKYLENYSLQDILIESAPIKRSTEHTNQEPVIKIIDPMGGYEYYRWSSYNDYDPLPVLMVENPGESFEILKTRRQNQYRYGYGSDYRNYVIQISETLNNVTKEANEDNIALLNSVWRKLSVDGTINYRQICV